MNRSFFQQQMNRLGDTFGVNQYKIERIEVIWKEVRDFSDSWFSKTVDKFIGECRHAPLMAEFRDEISKERERMAYGEKRQHTQDAKDFFQGTYMPDDVKAIVQTIVNKIQFNGLRIPDEKEEQDYQQFIKLLDNAAKAQKGDQHGKS